MDAINKIHMYVKYMPTTEKQKIDRLGISKLLERSQKCTTRGFGTKSQIAEIDKTVEDIQTVAAAIAKGQVTYGTDIKDLKTSARELHALINTYELLLQEARSYMKTFKGKQRVRYASLKDTNLDHAYNTERDRNNNIVNVDKKILNIYYTSPPRTKTEETTQAKIIAHVYANLKEARAPKDTHTLELKGYANRQQIVMKGGPSNITIPHLFRRIYDREYRRNGKKPASAKKKKPPKKPAAGSAKKKKKPAAAGGKEARPLEKEKAFWASIDATELETE